MRKKKPEKVLKKLQNFSQKVTKQPTPTPIMRTPLVQRTHQNQSKDRDSLHGWILALEASTQFNKLKQPPMQKASDQEISKQVEGKEMGIEPVLFDFGDGYCDGVNWLSVERALFMENFKSIKIPAFFEGFSAVDQEIKYSRDDVFKLSSQEDTMKEFFREKIF